ncbi:Fe-S protein assembly co-chaperone HscB [Porticoccus sp. W117]|uniref:Fe-S protein assembly co-chaperone HscB n=1 Tax=Porticoccus sp. W117 TaxID=3054777 RepID=UPI00259A3937|nr:Fe-S protein assembly co-chaperone HscB [Porticoccus sp. W117]MDM3870117.1 Fe-S protein assembly co-chaperone HscB [Porticoccus sp. W117]
MENGNSFFEILGISESFTVDLLVLSERYRELQQQFHPDRYADKPERERNLAVQWSATINQAFDTLKSPLKRAQYLLERQGLDSTGESTVSSDPMFLMTQMELRESLADVRDNNDPFAALDELRSRVSSDYRDQQASFAQYYDAGEYDSALDTVAKMQFSSKLLAEMELLEEDLDAL